MTMKDVAVAVGVTQATVSMALKGDPRISPAMRAMVKRVAEDLGYRPDPLVSALMMQRRKRATGAGPGTLGIVSLWPDPGQAWRTLPFYLRYREGVQDRARQLGFSLDYFESDGTTVQNRTLVRALRTRGIRGLIITQAHETFTTLPFSVEEFAAVYIGNGIKEPQLSRVDAALEFDFRLAWKNLRAAGYRRIGFVTWKVLSLKNDGAWVGAFLHAQRELAVKDRMPLLELEEITERAVEPWLEKYKPDAVLSEIDFLLSGLKKRYPELGCFSIALENHDAMSGVQVGRWQVGAAAVDLVAGQLSRGESGIPLFAKRVLIEGEWKAGLDPSGADG